MTVQTSLARLCLPWEQCMHLPAEPDIINSIKPKWPLWKNSWSFPLRVPRTSSDRQHAAVTPHCFLSGAAQTQLGFRPAVGAFMWKWSPAGRIMGGLLGQVNTIHMHGSGLDIWPNELSYRQLGRQHWNINSKNPGWFLEESMGRMKRPKCHRWHRQWGIYTIKYYLQKKMGNITIRRSGVLRSIPSLGQLQPNWAAWP